MGLCVMANRAVCEIRRGDAKAAATRSRRALVKAEAEGSPEMIMATHCIRLALLPCCRLVWALTHLYPSKYTLFPAWGKVYTYSGIDVEA